MKHPSCSGSALRSLALSSLLIALLGACGNTSRTSLRAPSDVPAFTIDVEASEVKVLGSSDAEEIRTLAAAALSSMATLQGGRLEPARFSAVVQAGTGSNPGAIFYCLLPSLAIGPVMAGIGASNGGLESSDESESEDDNFGALMLFSVGFTASIGGAIAGPLACPLSAYEAVVDLRLETARGVFVGRGTASHRLAQPDKEVWHATVHDAFQQALHSARRSGEPSAQRGPR